MCGREREKREIYLHADVPLCSPKVTLLVESHRFHFTIGNARNFVVMDIVRRYLEWSGYEVKFVQNLTDIDDKIIERANEEGCSTQEVVKRVGLIWGD